MKRIFSIFIFVLVGLPFFQSEAAPFSGKFIQRDQNQRRVIVNPYNQDGNIVNRFPIQRTIRHNLSWGAFSHLVESTGLAEEVYQNILNREGRCYFNEVGIADADRQFEIMTLAECEERRRSEEDLGIDLCPDRRFQRSFEFLNAEEYPVFPFGEGVLIAVPAILFPEEICKVNEWLLREEQNTFREVILWEEWNENQKRKFYEFIGNLEQGQTFDLRDPWDASDEEIQRTRENCEHWSGYLFERVRVLQGNQFVDRYKMLKEAECLDLRGEELADEDYQLAWIGKAALAVYLEMKEILPWRLSQNRDHLKAQFNPYYWSGPDAEYEMNPLVSHVTTQTPRDFADDARLKVYNASKAYEFFRDQNLIAETQYQTAANLFNLASQGNEEGEYQMTHIATNCYEVNENLIATLGESPNGLYTEAQIQQVHQIEVETLVREGLISGSISPVQENFYRDFYFRQIGTLRACDGRVNLRLDSNPDIEDYMKRGLGACSGIGSLIIESLQFLNIPAQKLRSRLEGGHSGSGLILDNQVYFISHNDDLYGPSANIYDNNHILDEDFGKTILMPERYFSVPEELSTAAMNCHVWAHFLPACLDEVNSYLSTTLYRIFYGIDIRVGEGADLDSDDPYENLQNYCSQTWLDGNQIQHVLLSQEEIDGIWQRAETYFSFRTCEELGL